MGVAASGAPRSAILVSGIAGLVAAKNVSTSKVDAPIISLTL